MPPSRHKQAVGPQGAPQGVIFLVRVARGLGPGTGVAAKGTRRERASGRKIGFPEQVDAPPLVLGSCQQAKVRSINGCLVAANMLRRRPGCRSYGRGGVSLLSAGGGAHDKDARSFVPSANQASLPTLGTLWPFEITLPKKLTDSNLAGRVLSQRQVVTYPLPPLSTCEAGFGAAWNPNHDANSISGAASREGQGANSGFFGHGKVFKWYYRLSRAKTESERQAIPFSGSFVRDMRDLAVGAHRPTVEPLASVTRSIRCHRMVR